MRSTTKIWVVIRHQYEISALVSQTSFRKKNKGGVTKCRLFSQANYINYVLSIVHECTRVLSTTTTNQRRIFVNYDSILNVRLQCEGLDCSIPVVFRKECTISSNLRLYPILRCLKILALWRGIN